MKNIVCLIFLLCTACGAPAKVFAESSTPVNLNVNLTATVFVEADGGNINSTINVDTGALGTAFAPQFRMQSNDTAQRVLTLKAEVDTTSGYQNAIFSNGATRYIILGHSSSLPTVSAINNIKSGSPIAESNPNAIAYIANNPTGTSNTNITYQSATQDWGIQIRNSGTARTTFTIPSGTPLSNTYSSDDEAGSYQALVTISFNP